MDYSKYYWLEKDFFPEICKFFHDKRYLTPEHFFSIISWKSNYNKPSIKEGLLLSGGKSLKDAVHSLTKKIYKAKTKEEKLEILIGDRGRNKGQAGVQLAMASAVLTVLYPKDFSVYDWRVRSQLKNPENKDFPDISYSKDRIKRYFKDYIPQVLQAGRNMSGKPKLSLRNCDRFLWGKSWNEDLKKFISK